MTVHSEILYFAESLQCIACLVYACCNLNVWIVFPSFFKLSRSRCDEMQPALPEPACACKPLGSWAPSYTLLYMPSYVGTLLYTCPLMPSYTYLLINPLTHTLLCMCIFSIGLQNHWAPSYTYPLIQSYVCVGFVCLQTPGLPITSSSPA